MIIGLGYRKHSGKDTVADELVRSNGFYKTSWADPLKRAVMEAFGWDERHVYGDLKEVVDPRWNMTPREALQHVGTDLFRNWIPDFWVRRTMMEVEHHQHVVIPDVRFPNEAQAIKDAGGIVWCVNRPSLGPPTDSHESETAMADYKNWDAIVHNDGTVEDLRDYIKQLMEAVS